MWPHRYYVQTMSWVSDKRPEALDMMADYMRGGAMPFDDEDWRVLGKLATFGVQWIRIFRIKDHQLWLIKSLLIKQMQVSYIWFSCSKFNRRVNIKYINAFVSNEFLKQDYAQNSKNSLLILWNQTFHFYIKTINRESFLMKHLVLK